MGWEDQGLAWWGRAQRGSARTSCQARLISSRGEGLEVGREVKEEEDLAPPSGGWSRLREGTVLLPVELQSEGEPWPCSGARLAGRQDPHTPDKDT